MPDGRLADSVSVGVFVDYESSLARDVAGAVWSGLSRAALNSGDSTISASWESLGAKNHRLPDTDVRLFAIGEDRPDAVDILASLARSPQDGDPDLYCIVVAVPSRPNPLSGALLYQGVEHLKENGVRVGAIEPAVLHNAAGECDSYAKRIFQRLTKDRADRSA